MELRQQIIADVERLPENALKAVHIFLRDIVIAEIRQPIIVSQHNKT